MIDNAIDKIIHLANANDKVTILGENYYTYESLRRIPQPDQTKPEPLLFSTLTGLIHYLQSNKDKLPIDDICIHITNPFNVNVCGPIQPANENKRFVYALSAYQEEAFQFGKWMDLEIFIIQMQSKFERTGTIAQVVGALANLASKEIRETYDNGFSLVLQVKTGIELREEVQIQNPLTVQPFMTFREIRQPAFECILRVKKQGETVVCALFEGDGGLWKIQAVERIKKWLEGETDGKYPIFA